MIICVSAELFVPQNVFVQPLVATEFNEELHLSLGKGLDELENGLSHSKPIFNNGGNYSHPDSHGNQARLQLLQHPTQHPVNFLLWQVLFQRKLVGSYC